MFAHHFSRQLIQFMKIFISSIVLAFTGLSAFSAQAGECDKYKTSYDKTYCMAKLFLESDKELNTVYGELRSVSRESVKQQLKSVQLNWIQYRNESCESHGSINVDCNYRVNRERAEYLRDRVRECKAGTCRDDMISTNSWH